jgi:adenylyltransferase/sulfurtransferase
MDEHRYARQTLFKPLGAKGQERLAVSTAVVVGCGALGSRAAELLARAGVGRIRVVDRDVVEWSNLQRQALFGEDDVKATMPKAAAAERRLRALNSGIAVEGVVADVTSWNILEIIGGADVVVDGLDNFETRYLLNDACVKQNLPWIYGGAVASYGVTMNVLPGKGPCLRCVFSQMPPPGGPTCDTAGILAPAAAWVAAHQAMEAVKILSGNEGAARRTLLSADLWKNRVEEISLPEKPLADCPACAKRVFEFLENTASAHVSLCGRNAVQVRPAQPATLDLEALASRVGDAHRNKYLVQFSANGCEMTVFADGRAMISGTDDVTTARSLYAKWVGA